MTTIDKLSPLSRALIYVAFVCGIVAFLNYLVKPEAPRWPEVWPKATVEDSNPWENTLPLPRRPPDSADPTPHWNFPAPDDWPLPSPKSSKPHRSLPNDAILIAQTAIAFPQWQGEKFALVFSTVTWFGRINEAVKEYFDSFAECNEELTYVARLHPPPREGGWECAALPTDGEVVERDPLDTEQEAMEKRRERARRGEVVEREPIDAEQETMAKRRVERWLRTPAGLEAVRRARQQQEKEEHDFWPRRRCELFHARCI
jgi:hypothetical protein